MGCKEVCSCRGRSATCVCAFIVLHVILAVTLFAALFTRFYVYKPLVMTDMYSDMRLLHNPESSIFCSVHRISSVLIDSVTSQTKTDDLDSNSLSPFDVYPFDKDPSKDHNRTQSAYNFKGIGSLEGGEYQHHDFNFLDGTHVDVGLCTEYVQEPSLENPMYDTLSQTNGSLTGLFVYFIRGKETLQEIVLSISKNNSELPCQGNNCPWLQNIKPSKADSCLNVETPSIKHFKNYVPADDQYFVLIFNPATHAAEGNGQKYRLFYNLNRTEYALQPPQTEYTKRRNFIAKPDIYLLLTFPYKHDFPSNYLDNIEIENVCDSNSIVYVGIFFFVPVAVLVVVGVVVTCCHERRTSHLNHTILEHEESASGPDRGLFGDREDSSTEHRGYGSTDAVYT